MHENDRLNGCLSEIELGFVEREATPTQFMKLGIQLHLRGLSLSNTISILDKFGIDRARSTVHNWVHKADLQPEEGRTPDHIAVDETVIRLNDEQYWLYAAVDPATNNLLYTKLDLSEPTRSLTRFSRNSARNTTLTTPCFSLTVPHRFKTLAPGTASILDTKNTVIGTALNVYFVK